MFTSWLFIRVTLSAHEWMFPSVEWYGLGGNKIVPLWNCSQQGLCLILNNWVMISDTVEFGEHPECHKCHVVPSYSSEGRHFERQHLWRSTAVLFPYTPTVQYWLKLRRLVNNKGFADLISDTTAWLTPNQHNPVPCYIHLLCLPPLPNFPWARDWIRSSNNASMSTSSDVSHIMFTVLTKSFTKHVC